MAKKTDHEEFYENLKANNKLTDFWIEFHNDIMANRQARIERYNIEKLKMTESVLVIGSGGREHALAWKLSKSPVVKNVYVSPGNAGTDAKKVFEINEMYHESKILNCNVNIKKPARVIEWCRENNISLVVVGPEDPLANGFADDLNKAGIPCFGCSRRAAKIEASKEFAKSFMDRHKIPTARWQSFQNYIDAQAHIESASYDALVVKASGLAAGKGVIVANNRAEAIAAVSFMKEEESLLEASETIVIEELLTGEEVSVLCFSDGTHISVMPPAQDYKRLYDDDKGPNTGGMGAYCPCTTVSDADLEFIKTNILQKAVDGMRADNVPFVGVLYAGIMLTKDGPKVLEFNCRFGDPETQVLMVLLKSDIYEIMLKCVSGTLNEIEVEWDTEQYAVGVVVVSGGYPVKYKKGKVITGLEKMGGFGHVFIAGVSREDGALVTSGGRVFAVVARSPDLETAIRSAHGLVEIVRFDGSYNRSDIGKRGLEKLRSKVGLTYKSSGVDIESADDLVGQISSLTKQTRRPELRSGIGGFAGIFELSNFADPFLVSKISTLGEKLQAAQDCKKYEVAGIDLVANSVNEILCCGAEPLFFLDTFTCGKLHVDIAAQVISGIAKACKEANCSLIGGETAEMPGMYDDADFDLTGFARGAVEKSQLLPQKKQISNGDVAIALLAPHLNSIAFKIAKKIMDKLSLTYENPAPFDKSRTLKDVLLQPRNIYVSSVLPLMRSGSGIKAAAFMSDYGIMDKVDCILPHGNKLVLDASKWVVPPIFNWIAENGDFSQQDMLRYTNYGIDMILIAKESSAGDTLSQLKARGVAAVSVGSVLSRQTGEEAVEILNANFPRAVAQKKKVAVLTSEKGNNLDALIEYTLNPVNLSGVEVALVVANDEGCLKKAKAAKIPTKVLKGNETSLADILKMHHIEIVCLDAFPQELTRDLLGKWRGRILNVHPSLLPAFACPNVHKEVIEFGARITGCTAYLEEGEGLSGKILEQAAINVEVQDTVDTLEEKALLLQNQLYPKALEILASENPDSDTSQFRNICPESPSERLRSLKERIRSLMLTTARPGFESIADSPCDIFDLGASNYKHPYLLSGTDGVGTKLKIAQALNKHDTIGIDLVAMCVNDILTHGAEPLFFLECFSCGKINEKTILSVVSGIAEGCKQANCALIGADINEMPNIYTNSKKPVQEFNSYDVVGYAEGAMQREHLLPRLSDIKEGDLVIGLASSGVHSNGFSLVRKLVQVRNFLYQDPFPLDKSRTLGEVLLTPTKIYVQSMMPLVKEGLIKAAAHITGGGLTCNIPRVLPPHLGVALDGGRWQLPPILQWVTMEAQMTEAEMLKTFNCGLGMVLVVAQEDADRALEMLAAGGETAAVVGSVQQHREGSEQVVVENFKVPVSSFVRRKKKVGVLISGSGTNLQSLIDYTKDPSNCSSAEIVLVLSNVPDVEGLKRAQRANIPTKVLSHKEFKKRVDFDMAVHAILKESGVEIVCLAGFMRIVSKEFVQLWQGRLLNVHPAILPAFKGMNAHKLMLERGAKVTGCTVHFVEAEVDAGAVIEQAAVRVSPHDDEKSIQEKVKVMEHRIFPLALELLASGRVARGTDGKLQWN